jgi:hypothetical protein
MTDLADTIGNGNQGGLFASWRGHKRRLPRQLKIEARISPTD